MGNAKSGTDAGFVQPTGAAAIAADSTADLTGDGVVAAAATSTSRVSVGTSSTSEATAPTGTGTVVESGKSAGGVLEVDLKTVIGLGFLGLIAAAVLL